MGNSLIQPSTYFSALILVAGLQSLYAGAALSAVTQSAPVEKEIAALKGLQKVYGANKDFSASFEQKLFNRIMRREDTSTGTIRFLKPNRVRWDYLSPHKKSFIVNSTTLWIYQESDKQAQINRCFSEDLLSASLAFLINPAGLDRDFSIVQLGNIDSNFMLRFTPKKKHQIINEMVLAIDTKSFRIKKSIIKDMQGNINQFTFLNEDLNPSLDEKIFSFSVPSSVTLSDIGNCPAEPKKQY